jgi:urease accessory protein UreE
VEFAIAIERGTVLREDDALVVDELPLVVIVHERAEPVLEARPRTTAEWGLWAYHIGNAHQPVMIAADALVCPDVPGVEQVFDYHRIPFTRAVRPFTPVSQAPGHHAA